MAAQGNRTFLTNMVDPEVLADMVSGKLSKYIRVSPFARIDTTLEGRAGSTVKVPFYGYIGDATVVAEGEEIGVAKLTTSTKTYSVKKYANGVTITDEAVLSGYGDPVGQAASQLAKSIDAKIDDDCMTELLKSTTHVLAGSAISYNNIVDGVGAFEEEINSNKVMFIAPAQEKALRKDSNFISADKYGAGTNVIMYGEIGMICNTRIVVSKRVTKNADTYYEVSSSSGALTIVADSTENPSASEVKLATVKAAAINGYEPEVGDYVKKLDANNSYINPIIRLVEEDDVETGVPALTIYMKKNVEIEPDREANKKQTSFYADLHCVPALTNGANVCLLYLTA